MEFDLKNTAVIYILLSSIVVFLISFSGMSESHILYPMSSGISLFDGSSDGISLFYLILGVIFFSVSCSLVSVYGITSKDPDFALIVAPVVTSLFILLLGGISLSSLMISIGLVASVFAILYISVRDKELYKKISAYNISSKSTIKALRILSIFVAFSAYLLIPSDPADVESIVRSDLDSSMSSFIPADTTESMVEQNKALVYKFLESSEKSLLNSMESGTSGDLTPEQSKICAAALEKNMANIDRNAKMLVDLQLGAELEKLQSESLIPPSLVDAFVDFYPIMVFFIIFMSIEFFGILISPLSGLFASVLYSLSEEDKPARKQSFPSNQSPRGTDSFSSYHDPYYSH